MNIRDLFDPMFDAMADHIERTKNDNELRYDYWRIMSSSNWANRDYEKLVDGALGFLQLESNNYRQDERLERILPDIIERWVLMDMSDWAVENRDIANSLSSDVLRQCKRSQDELSAILRDIEDMNRRGDRERDRTDRNRVDNRDRQSRDRSSSRDSGRGVPSRGMASGSRLGGGGSASRRPTSGLSGALESNERSSRSSRSEREEPEPARQRPERSTVTRSGAATSQSDSNDRVRHVEVKRPALDGPDFTLARPFDEFYDGTDCWQAAHCSKFKLTPMIDQMMVYETAFNPRKKMRFYVRNQNNIVREELKDMSRETDYMRHELNAVGRSRITNPENPKYTPTENPGYVAPGSIPEESLMLQRAGLGKVALFSGTVICATSREEGEMVAQFEQMRSAGQTTVFTYCVTTPVVVNSMENMMLLRDVGESINLTDAVVRMKACVDKVDGGVWEYVNTRLTKMVNSVARNYYAIPAEIADFTKDYEKLINWIKSKDEMLARNFSLFTRYIPGVAVMELSEELRRGWLMGALDLTEEEFDARDPSVICFESFYSAIMVNFTLGDLGLALTEKSQKIDPLVNQALHSLLEKAVACNTMTSDNSTMYILTRDRMRIEVIPSVFDQGQFMLRVMKD